MLPGLALPPDEIITIHSVTRGAVAGSGWKMGTVHVRATVELQRGEPQHTAAQRASSNQQQL